MRVRFSKLILILITLVISLVQSNAQKVPADIVAGIPVNYDESLVGEYTLPDPLVFLNGEKAQAPGGGQFGRINIDQSLSQGIGAATLYYGALPEDYQIFVDFIKMHFLPGK